MKPWQTSLNKAPSKGGGKNKERGPKSEPDVQKPEVITNGQIHYCI